MKEKGQSIKEMELADIIDHKTLQALMDDFYRLTHIGVGIIDLKGQVLVGTGWQDVCTKFHRENPDTCKHCIESDIELSSGITPGTFKLYKCKNNMWDIATPIMLGNSHVGNLFLGQFFFDDEEIPFDIFRNQARKYGFDEKEYMEALERVPRWNRITVDTVMSFYTRLTDLISRLSYSNIELERTLEEHRQAKEKLAEETTRKLIFFEQSYDGIAVIDKNGKVLEANQNFADMLDYSPEELRQMHVWDWEAQWTREELKERFFNNSISADETMKNVRLETQHRRRDGSIYDVEVSTNATIVNGQEMHFSVYRDITEIKQTEKAYRKSEERLALAMEVSDFGFWDLDIDTDQVYLSPSVYKLTGYDTEELPKQFHETITTLVHPDDRDKLFKAFEESIELLKPIDHDFRIRNIPGETMWVSIRGKPISIDDSGHSHRFIGTIVDITTRVNAEEALLYARAAADESNRIKTEMIQNISHELRTPLISVIGFSDVLLNDSENFTEIQKKFLQNIHESGNNLDDMVEKFLDFVHTEQESVDTFYPQSIDLKKIISGTCDLLAAKAAKKNINLSVEIDQNIDTIVADPYKLKTILFNLTENAIKFTDNEGSIKVEAEISNGEVIFSVNDNGIGIAEEKLESIFEPFIQMDGSSTRKYGGAGLGLALVKRLVEMHGGQIHIKSTPGKGSDFIFTIPLEVPDSNKNAEDRNI